MLGKTRIPLTLCIPLTCLSSRRLSIPPFLPPPTPPHRDLLRGIQFSLQVCPLNRCHNQGVQVASPWVPTPLRTHHLLLAFLL